VIDNLIKEEIERCDLFAYDTPDIMLPVDLEISSSIPVSNVAGSEEHVDLPFKGVDMELNGGEFPPWKPVDSVLVGMGQSSPECSMKEPNSSELWIEVVKKGRKKARPRNRCDKMVYNERGILEY
jgi:hypothetical protein